MAEYIGRDAAIKAAKHAWAKGLEPSQYIEILPVADVAPVRHAEWVVCGDGDNVPWMCSHCGKTTAHKYKVMYGKYCPHCWAKMDGAG
jgi:hypothetical protein|nr:MAG TPA: zinc-ribbon protein [Caudoviricetes sp.]